MVVMESVVNKKYFENIAKRLCHMQLVFQQKKNKKIGKFYYFWDFTQKS